MGVLSYQSLKKLGTAFINNFTESQIQPASYDIRLGNEFTFIEPNGGYIDTADPETVSHNTITAETVQLEPFGTVLAETEETVHIPSNCVGIVDGRSSFARLFVSIHQTAGFCDPAFEGTVTLEVFNANPYPIRIHASQRVGQIRLMETDEIPEKVYGELGNSYQNQRGATPSAMQFD